MKKITSYVLFAVAVMGAASCTNQGFKKTKSGLQYKIISNGSNSAAVKYGQFLKITFIQKIHDSVLSQSVKNLPEYVRVDSVGPTYNPAEVFALLHKGDSAVIVLQADTLQRRYGGQLPPFIKKKDKIVLYLRVQDVLLSEDVVKADQKKYFDAEKESEMKALEDYMAKNGITNAQKTKDGAYYQITSEGTGPQADSGKLVSVKYTGYSLTGEAFDSNTDSTKQSQPHPLTPFQFRSGVSGAIRGMVEAIQGFKQGGKGKMFIPAMLGYGAQGSGKIKPFENMVFDIEVVEVKDAPAPSQKPMMPPGFPPHK